MTLADCTVSGNSAGGTGGGGLFNLYGQATLTDCTVSGNSAVNGGGLSNGGTATLTNCTVSGNTALDGGGGLFSYGSYYNQGDSTTLTNCTVSGNSAYRGGGLYLTNATTVIRNSTIAFNAATVGGGIRCDGMPTIDSSIVAKNIGGTGPDLYGQVTATFSLIGDTSGTVLYTASANNLLNRDPLLGPLADNGGPTWTHALLPSSPASNAGNNPANLTTDQRGAGFLRVFGSVADIGAFELQQATIPSVVVNAGQGNLIQWSMVTSVTVTFSDSITFTGSAAAAFQLARTGPRGPTGEVTLAVDLSASTDRQTIVRLSFSGPLTEFGSLIDGNYTLTVSARVFAVGVALDSNPDRAHGGDLTVDLYRLYGDLNGDRAVNEEDLKTFRHAFGTVSTDAAYLPCLDFNRDGEINGTDLTQFRKRFGVAK
jgi:hypothetical protein